MTVELFQAKVNAPAFPRDLQWLNTARPLDLSDLRGKIVLLDFWTFCCINCLHVLVQLRGIEEKYRDSVVVVGVHSAKFRAERATEAVRAAILRYDVRHPVVNDRDMRVWQEYTVRAWPTLMIIDPAGKVIGRHEGEVLVDALDTVLAGLVADYDARGLLDHRPLQWQQETRTDTTLAFPGKVVAHNDRLFIADTNHNRIVVTDLDGQVQEVYGSGIGGLRDGSADSAQFCTPQGMAVHNDTLFVADTGNHAIRSIDLAARSVTTLAGTGEESWTFVHDTTPGLITALNSPWDVSFADGFLYITMAGLHQIWRLNPQTGMISTWAGTGNEGIADDYLSNSLFAQPSGIAYVKGEFYVADSESSAIRRIDLVGRVHTLVGQGLYSFGDTDGAGESALLQHPLGLAAGAAGLYIADTYNNKIKLLNPETAQVVTLFGDPTPGYRDGDAQTARFNEPGGLSFAGNILYIADTNNHVIRTADLSMGEIGTLEITGL